MLGFEDLSRGGTAPTTLSNDNKDSNHLFENYSSNNKIRPKTRSGDNDLVDFNISLKHNKARKANYNSSLDGQEKVKNDINDFNPNADSSKFQESTLQNLDNDDLDYSRAMDSFQAAIDSWSGQKTSNISSNSPTQNSNASTSFSNENRLLFLINKTSIFFIISSKIHNKEEQLSIIFIFLVQ